MSVVLSTHSVSLDGFIARPDGKPGRLHEWLSGGDAQTREVLDDLRARVGATIVGRKTYEDSDWGDEAPFDGPVFVRARGAEHAISRDLAARIGVE